MAGNDLPPSAAFEITVEVLVGTNGFQENQPYPIVETVPEQIKLSVASELEDQQIGQIALLPFANGRAAGNGSQPHRHRPRYCREVSCTAWRSDASVRRDSSCRTAPRYERHSVLARLGHRSQRFGDKTHGQIGIVQRGPANSGPEFDLTGYGSMLGGGIRLGLLVERLVNPDGSGGWHLYGPYYICGSEKHSAEDHRRQETLE